MVDSCPVCGSEDREDVLSLPQVPVLINAQVTPDAAGSVARGDIDLVVCHGCAHMYNRSFDESLLDYDAAYENTLHYSPSFRAFAGDLAERLVADLGLANGTVAELGSGPGHFLSMLCERGVTHGFGFDPSYDPDRLGSPENPAVAISTDLFPGDGSLEVDLAFSQHVLEHLENPVAALEDQRAAIVASSGAVYSEVPNGGLMIERCALWDLIYEHLSYFVPMSLSAAHERAGLAPYDVSTAFGGQFLWCLARSSDKPSGNSTVGEPTVMVEQARAFGDAARLRIEDARSELRTWADAGPVVLWGAGSKGMTYLNVVDDESLVDGVVDINPRKAGWAVPGTGHRIGGPSDCGGIRPATVIVANPMYADEVAAALRDRGLSPRIVPLWA